MLSVNSAHDAVAAFKAGIGGVGDGAVWADLNTGSPGLKRELDGIARQGGVPFADVAIMAPVPGRGLRTPMLAAGDGAARVAALLGPLGARVEVMDAGRRGRGPQAAPQRVLQGARRVGRRGAGGGAGGGCEDWLRGNIVEELSAAGEHTVDRLVDGTYKHAVRRAAEMEAAATMLDELDVPPTMAAASRDLLRRLSG